ncbi:MAG: rane protein of unknown function [Conexibacter sp.]|nr:rane protein of unknown function [Conexibacter sp.]
MRELFRLRTAVTLLVAAGALLVLSPIVPGYDVAGLGSALAAAAIAGALNALVWPIVMRVALPLTVLTIGGAVLALNGAMLLLVAAIVPGVTVDDLGTAIVVTLAVTAITGLTAAALSIDDDARFASHVAHRRARPADPIRTTVPGVLFLEIDGLAHAVLQRALRDGHVPTLAAWIADGDHVLTRWETDWSSQTGACQAGILHGDNHDMPAFRWWEKDRGGPIVTNHPRDAAELERRISDGRGLLHDDGASRANILSGDAAHSLLTMSTVLDVRRGRLGADYYTYFASPYNVARTLLLTIGDMATELANGLRQRRRDERPRVPRPLAYAPLRAFATAIQLDLQVEAVIGDVQAGRPTVYTTFLAYDEVAHHSGIERHDTLAVLRRVDQRIARIARAAARGPRPYELVVLSDHGQTQGATFADRYGTTLEAMVRGACATAAVATDHEDESEAGGQLKAALAEAATGDSASARAVRVVAGRHAELERADGGAADGAHLPEIAVMASGCLGLVSFPRLPGRVDRATIDDRYPELLSALIEHPGIGFVVVRDGARDVVLGDLSPYGARAAAHVARTAAFPHCPDILVNSTYWPQTDEVAAFEELVGSHGGLGGPQSFPFVLAPAALAMPDRDVVGAADLHRVLRGWLAALGHTAFQEEQPPSDPATASPGSATRPSSSRSAASAS